MARPTDRPTCRRASGPTLPGDVSAAASPRPHWRQRLDLARSRATAFTDRLRADIPGLDLVWELGTRYRSRNGSVLIGHVAYRLFLWVAPLLLLFTGVLGISVTQDINVVQYASEVGVSENFASDVARQAEAQSIASLVVGGMALLIATWSLVQGVHLVYAQVWGLEIRPRKHMVRAILLTIGAAVVAVAANLVIAAIQRQGLLLAMGGWLVSVAVITVGLWLVCWSLPRRTSHWLDLAPGAALAALGFSAVNVFAAVYIPAKVASASELYGGLGVAFAVLFYLFLVACLVVGMALVNSVWVDRAQVLAGRGWLPRGRRLVWWRR